MFIKFALLEDSDTENLDDVQYGYRHVLDVMDTNLLNFAFEESFYIFKNIIVAYHVHFI